MSPTSFFTLTELVLIFLASKAVLGIAGAVAIGVEPVRVRLSKAFSSPQTDPRRLLGP